MPNLRLSLVAISLFALAAWPEPAPAQRTVPIFGGNRSSASRPGAARPAPAPQVSVGTPDRLAPLRWPNHAEKLAIVSQAGMEWTPEESGVRRVTVRQPAAEGTTLLLYLPFITNAGGAGTSFDDPVNGVAMFRPVDGQSDRELAGATLILSGTQGKRYIATCQVITAGQELRMEVTALTGGQAVSLGTASSTQMPFSFLVDAGQHNQIRVRLYNPDAQWFFRGCEFTPA